MAVSLGYSGLTEFVVTTTWHTTSAHRFSFARTRSWLLAQSPRAVLRVDVTTRIRSEGDTHGCILTGHGSFADGLAGALEMVGGPQTDFVPVTFYESEAAEFSQKVADAISSMASSCDGILVFCDLMGGTPFNQAMMNAATIPGVEVVTGANLPMLLETLSCRTESSTLDELVECALTAGKMGVDHRVLDASTDTDEDEEDGL